jgi:O-antigen/teichoic acid export membrane protein
MCRDRGEITPRLAVFIKGVVAAVSLMMLMSALVGPEALRLLWDGKYAAGESAMRALLLGAILAVFDAVAYQLLLARGRERTIARTAVVATAVQAALNIVLIPRWGILGAVSGMFGLIVVVGALNGAAVREEIAQLGWGFVVYPAAVATAGGLILLISPDAVSRVLLGIGIWAVASAALLLPHAAELLYGLRLGVHVDKRAV